MATKRTNTKTQAARKTTKKRASKRPSKAPPKRTTKARKASASKRPSKAPSKAPSKRPAKAAATNGSPTNGAARKAKPARKRPSKAPSKSGVKRTTRPAKVGAVAKSGQTVPRPAPIPDVVTVTAPVPEDWTARTSAGSASHARSRDSYLDDTPRDHAELLAGFLRVVKTAAGDIRKLILQAIALSNQRRDRFDR